MAAMRTTSLAVFSLALTLAAPTKGQDLYDPDTVRDIYLTFSQPNYWQTMLNNYSSKTNIPADMVVDGQTFKDVGVRFRGNTSYRRLPAGSLKRSFNLELDDNIPGQELYGYNHLNLNNGYSDPTFMREFMMYMVCRRYMCAPKANFVRVHLNGEYWGIYINVQQPNKDMMGEWFATNGGNRYRGTRNGNLTWLGSNVSNYTSAYEFKQGNGVDLVNMINVLNNTPTAQLRSELPKVLSVDQELWYIACNNILLQLDSYIGTGKDHSLYHDEEHDTFHMFPFDVNEMLGAQGLGGSGGGNANTSPWFNSTNSSRPAFSKPMLIPEWRARYISHYREVLDESFSWPLIEQIITKYQALISASVAADNKKLFTTAQFTQNVTQNINPPSSSGSTRTISGIKPLVEARHAYLTGLSELSTVRPTLSELTHTPTNPQPTDDVYVTARISSNAASVTLHHRIRGPFGETPMFDNGLNGDGQAGDGVYGAKISALPGGTLVDYYVAAANAAGDVRYEPKTAEFQPPSFFVSSTNVVVINEILADNDSGDVDENGEYEDWVEVHNTSPVAYDLSGHYLTDNLLESTKWQFPAGTTVPANGFLRVWCDEETTQGPLHANFKLSKDGEQVGLFQSEANGNSLIDAIVFGEQKGDRSYGRIPDGTALWFYVYTPTGNAPLFTASGGAVRYDPRRTGNPNNFDLRFSGGVQAGAIASMDLTGGPALSPAFVLIGVGPSNLPVPPFGPLSVNPVGAVAIGLSLNANGDASLQFGVPPGLSGLTIYGQGLSAELSNSLTVRF